MPTVNSIGQIIQDAHVEPEVMKRIQRIALLQYPAHEDVIFHLSPGDFKNWLHWLSPREALLMCSTEGLSDRIKRQLSWKRWSVVTDFFWRLCH